MSNAEQDMNAGSVAIVGLAGRFPGAKDVHQFWGNLANGVESITCLKDEELETGDASLWSQPNFVRARGVLEDVDMFDANFWGMLPREAEITDPQHRVFMECAWQALEDAGYDSAAYKGAVGVFAGCSMNTYFLLNLCSDRKLLDEFTRTYQVGSYPTLVGNHIDFLATRVAYKLNLRGPAYTMQCGCSTSLVAVCQACQSLLTYQSDMALAGGVSASFPQKRGYLYQPDGMASPDGHCRTFDAQAQGTVFGSGAAVVLLKRLDDAIADGDHIYAVIKGFALNNDGSAKVGFAAPGIEGQAEVIAMAQASAGVSPESISYMEAHGTGTPLGDPIEVAAATKVFRASTKAKGFCAIGTAKTNVGHLDIAAGATGLIKTVLSLKNGQLPPTLHFERPNPKLDLENSPFYVNTKLTEWKRKNGQPRRAGVSAFGVGGTNAHVIVEEAPVAAEGQTKASLPARELQLLVLSAKTPSALDQATANLAEHLKKNNDQPLADVAYTLQVGRRPFEQRRFVVAHDSTEAIRELEKSVEKSRQQLSERSNREQVTSGGRKARRPSIVFMFPGQGAQYCQMGAQLYTAQPEFRKWVDECADILTSLPLNDLLQDDRLQNDRLQKDLRQVMYPKDICAEDAQKLLTSTSFAQPALFTTEFALAKLWMSWGIQPDALIGHSIGEFVAACLGGVFSLPDALRLVATRGRMMQDLPSGSMMAVRLPETELRSYLSADVSIAAVNSPALCVVSGPTPAIEKLEKSLNERGVLARRLHTSHAFHSSMMDPVVDPFMEVVKQVSLSSTSIPYVSGVSGAWVTEEQTTDPRYWASHLREPVRFADGLASLSSLENAVMLEVGPGVTLNTLALQHPAMKSGQIIVNSLPDVSRTTGDFEASFNALGRVWVAGAQPNWESFHQGERLHRVSLPTYPFERKRYWISPANSNAATGSDVQCSDGQQVSVKAAPSIHSAISAEQARPQDSLQNTSHPMVPPEVSMSRANERQERVQQTLLSMFQDLSGIGIADLNPATSFMELGFDSLFLTQVTQELQNKFGLKITFRQLLDKDSTVEALAAYIHSKLPAEAVSDPAVVPAIQPSSALPPVAPGLAPLVRLADSAGMRLSQNASPTTASPSLIEALMKEQLRTMSDLMSRQLEVLRSGAVATTSVPAAEPVEFSKPASAPAVASSQPELKPAISQAMKEEPKAFGPYKPLSKGPQGALTPQQEKHVADLIDRYTKKTAESKRLTQKYRRVMADPRVVSGFRSQWKEMVYPIVTNRSEGSKLYDVDGNEYIDILNGYGPTVFGHKPKFVIDAVRKQLELGFEIGPMSPLAGKVAEMISEFTGMERVAFCNTGSEAVLCAMRIARTATGRNKIVMFTGDYHGMFDEVLVRGVNRPGQPARSLPIAPGIPPQAAENIVVLDYGTPASLEYIRAHASEFAAVMVEPVQSRHPNLQPREFLHELRKITADAGTALIFDEVVTGFRTHPGGAQAIFGIHADIATYGKIIGGGLPIGILAGKPQFMDTLDGGMWQYGDDSFPEVGVTFFAGTFVRHPLALAATYSVLQHLKEQGPKLQERLNEKTAKMVGRLNAFLRERELPLEIQNFASIFFFSFPIEMRFGSLFYYHMRAKGIHVQEGFPCFLTTAHTEADIERIITGFQESIAEMQADGMLPFRSAEVPASVPAVGAGVVIPVQEAPLTEVQMEVWLSAQLSDEASCAFNESSTLQLHGHLDEGVLLASIQDIVDRHDALRTTFSATGDRQFFASGLRAEIARIDLSALDEGEQDTRIGELKDAEARRPFDLVHGPVIRFKLVRFANDRHELIFTAHHIVFDGWSTNIILDELSRIYSEKAGGKSANLPKPLSFGSYAQGQIKPENEPEARDVEKYWLSQFSELPPDIDLPTDRPRPAVRLYEGSTYRRKINAGLYQSIKRAGAKRGCTLFVTLLAGFEALLSRLTSQDDIVVGVPTAGQSLLEGQTLVGHCVNFLPVRARMSGGMKFSELLASQKRAVLDAYDHQTYTYGTLVRKLSLQRDRSRLPLMEVQFNLERVGSAVEFSGLRAEVDANGKAFVNFDLFLNIVESDEGLLLDCDYNTGLYDESTIGRWLQHYETLLGSFAADADIPIHSLPLLTSEERQRILVDWNATEAEYPRGLCVHELIEQQAERTPNAIAVVFGDKRLTYRELNERANQIAHHLTKMGMATTGVRTASANQDAVIGICMDRSLEMMVALIGIWKSGAAYLPLDPFYPKERIDFILKEARVPILLTQSHLALTFSDVAARIVCLDTDWQLIARESKSELGRPDSPEGLAYLIYTSGSTGKPKGVEVLHSAVVNLLWSMRRSLGLEATDKLLAVTTLSFDIAALELFLPLCVGSQVVIASRETASDPVQLMAMLKNSRATIMQATPATWRMLLDAGWDGKPLRAVLCGGEALSMDLAGRLLKGSGSVWNLYGPTETTIWSAAGLVRKEDAKVTIGPPIANTEFYILDTHGEASPIGVPGELCISGAGLARGYYLRPELTEQKFVSNPFRPNSRMYRTGDLARYLPNGRIEFLGRLDNQVKLRGFRIELGEIEAALSHAKGVREAAVIVREDNPGDRRLVAYYVPETSGSTLPVSELKTSLQKTLPEYMVPSAFVSIDRMPRIPSGKLDRRALPSPDPTATGSKSEIVLPQTPEENKMSEIWAEVLKLKQVGITDNLFELGADSLHVFQIVARANKVGIKVTAKLILQHKNIQAIVKELSNSNNNGNGSAAAPSSITAVSRDKYRVRNTIA
jgi:amino acid adenylation domain-containing protein